MNPLLTKKTCGYIFLNIFLSNFTGFSLTCDVITDVLEVNPHFWAAVIDHVFLKILPEISSTPGPSVSIRRLHHPRIFQCQTWLPPSRPPPRWREASGSQPHVLKQHAEKSTESHFLNFRIQSLRFSNATNLRVWVWRCICDPPLRRCSLRHRQAGSCWWWVSCLVHLWWFPPCQKEWARFLLSTTSSSECPWTAHIWMWPWTLVSHAGLSEASPASLWWFLETKGLNEFNQLEVLTVNSLINIFNIFSC